MHHVAGTVDNQMLPVGDGIVALLFVGALGLMALLAVDDEHGASDAAEKFDGLGGVEGLRRRRAMQRIELPKPFASVILFHGGLCECCGKSFLQSRIGLS